MDPITTVATAAGLAWASGLRLYAVLFAAGVAHLTGVAALPEDLRILAHPLVLAVSGALFLVEFLADKIPGVDTVWDAVHTFIRIPAGALLAVGALAPVDAPLTLAAALVGGTLAGSSHFTKAGGRVLINASPEPVSNWAASLSEDAVALTAVWAALKYPLVLLALLVVLVALSFWMLPKILRAVRSLVSRLLPARTRNDTRAAIPGSRTPSH
jgi:hypothetical protein